MNGQLSEQPLAELIREFLEKSLVGRLQLQHDRVKIVIYFDNGELVYAASNLRTLRLREYLLKAGIAEAALARYDERRSDIELAKALCADYVLLPPAAEQIQTRQVSDVLRLALSWTEGSWEFDPRSRLTETPQFKIDTAFFLLEPPVDDSDNAETFLERLSKAQTHYDVLEVSKDSSAAEVKTKYYGLARRYHPDRFRKAQPALIPRLESAFARITQAYDTLRDDRRRANYDAKLQARQRAQQRADAASKPATPAPTPSLSPESAPKPGLSVAERAELQFKEGLEALELGQRKVAIGLFAAAANAMPNEARYRAFYGRMLAEDEPTRRAAEAELQAAIKLDPANGEYRVMLAELYRDLGFTLRARGEAERAIASDPNNRKARDLLRVLKSV